MIGLFCRIDLTSLSILTSTVQWAGHERLQEKENGIAIKMVRALLNRGAYAQGKSSVTSAIQSSCF